MRYQSQRELSKHEIENVLALVLCLVIIAFLAVMS
jgi:hypothetical protein